MTPLITTKRLLLRPLVEQDAEAMLEGLGNFAVARWTGRVPWPYHRDDALDFIAFTAQAESPSRFMAITQRLAPEKLIGVISYQYQSASNDAELGYWLAEPYWGQGFGREAAQAMVTHAFETDSIETLVASFQDGNTASSRILLSLGFALKSHGTAHSLAQKRDVPVTYLALPGEDWKRKRVAGH